MTEKTEENSGGGFFSLIIIGLICYFTYSYFFSSPKDDLKNFVACGRAANELGKYKAKAEIEKKLETYIKENEEELGTFGSPSRLLMEINQEINDNWNLYNKNSEGALYILASEYNSCSDIHNQKEISGLGIKFFVFSNIIYPIIY